MNLSEELGIPIYSYKEGEEKIQPRNIDVGDNGSRTHGHLQDNDWITLANAIHNIHMNNVPYYISTINKDYQYHQLAVDIDGETELTDVDFTTIGNHVANFIKNRQSTNYHKWNTTCLITKRRDRTGRYHLHWGACHMGANSLLELTRELHTINKDVDLNYPKQGCLRTIYVPKISRIDNKWVVEDNASEYVPWGMYTATGIVSLEATLHSTDHFAVAVKTFGHDLATILWSCVGMPSHIAELHWGIAIIKDKRAREPKPIEEEEEEEEDEMAALTNSNFKCFNMMDRHEYFDDSFHAYVRGLLMENPKGSAELMIYVSKRFALCGKDVYRKSQTGIQRVGTVADLMFPAELIVKRKAFQSKKKFMSLKDFWLNWAYQYAPQPAFFPYVIGGDMAHIPQNALNTFRGLQCYLLSPDTIDWAAHQANIDYILWASWIRFFSCNDYMCWMFWNWVAHITQKPQIKTQKAPVFKSAEGTGKSDLINRLADHVFGRTNVWSTSDKQDITGHYSYWADYLLIELSENIVQDDAAMSRLKDLITNSHSSCNLKFKDPTIKPNFANFIITSNNSSCLKLDHGPSAGRRWLVPDMQDVVPVEYGFTFEEWDKAWKESGDVFGVLLANKWIVHSVFDYELADMRSNTRREIRKASMSFVERAYLDWITTGNNYFIDGKPLGWHITVPVNHVINYFTRDRRYRVVDLDVLATYGVETRGDTFVFPHTALYGQEMEQQKRLQREYDEAKVRSFGQAKNGQAMVPAVKPPEGWVDSASSWWPFSNEADLRKELSLCLSMARHNFSTVECDFDFEERQHALTHKNNNNAFILRTRLWYM